MPGITSDNTLIRVSVGALIVFGALYVLDSFGAPGMTLIAIIIGFGVLIAHQKNSLGMFSRRIGEVIA